MCVGLGLVLAAEPAPGEQAPHWTFANAVRPRIKPTPPPVAAGATDRQRGLIAIVIDDLGLNRRLTRRAIALRPPLTLSFLSYAPHLAAQTTAAAAAGHELLLHLPMEPVGTDADPGPAPLRVGLGTQDLRSRLDRHLAAFTGYVGVNNHMGSRFTADAGSMGTVLTELRHRNLFFLDSLTTPHSVGVALAKRIGLRHAARDVFLDVDRSLAGIARQVRQVERIARRTGSAIAIGHPYESTLGYLPTWLAGLPARGLRIVPVSRLLRTPRPMSETGPVARGQTDPGWTYMVRHGISER